MIEFRRRLRAEWWNALAAAIAAIFIIRSLAILVTLALPVRSSALEVALALLAFIAAAAVLGVFAVDYVKQAAPFKAQRPQFAYAALIAGGFALLLAAVATPFKQSAEAAYAADKACSGDIDNKDKATDLCSVGTATVSRGWFGPAGQPYLVLQRDGRTETTQLDCPGGGLVLATARNVRTIRVDAYRGRVARIGAGGLVCETTTAPSGERTAREWIFAVFGGCAAFFGWWIRWGSAQRSRRLAARQTVSSVKTL